MPTVTLQPGPDVVEWHSGGGVYVIENFEAGAGGDRLTNWEFFFNWFPGGPNRWWFEQAVIDNPAAVATNPFESGQLQIIDSAEGALFQYRSSVTAAWETMIVFKGVQASQLTEYNLGWSPAGGRPSGGVVTHGDERDVILDTAGDDIIHTLGGDDFVRIGHGNDIVYLGDGNDTIYGIGARTGHKIIYGGAGHDNIGIQGVEVAPGHDSVVSELYGEDGDDSLKGGNNDDLLDGGADRDFLDGKFGDDQLFGGTGDDFLTGDRGNDLLVGGQGNDTIFGGVAFGRADHPGDIDTVTYADALAGVTVDLRPTVEVYGSLGDLYLGGTASDGLGGADILVSVERVIGSAFADTVQGHGRNVIETGAGDDRIADGVKDYTQPNLLVIEAQSEILNGVAAQFAIEIDGQVIATLQFDPTPSSPGGSRTAPQRFEFELDARTPLESLRLVHLNAEGGQRDIQTYFMGVVLPDLQGDIYLANDVTYTPEGGTPRFFIGQMHTGGVLDFDVSVYNDAIGTDFTDNDHYDGGAGIDTVVYSGASTDYGRTQESDGSWTIVDLRPGSPEGTDRLYRVEQLQFSDGLFDMSGAPVLQDINGTAGADTMNGTAAADTINGLGGDDVIFAGAGQDLVNGGDGNDTLVGNADIFAQESDALDGGAGDDLLYGEFTDTLNGGAGRDSLIAVNGYDFNLDMTATSIEYAVMDFGNDTITAAGQSVRVDVFASGGNDSVTGSNFDDLLFGGSGNDTVIGGLGADAIVGEAGADSLNGGDGDDRIYLDAQDSFVSGGAGYDAGYITPGTGAGAVVDLGGASLEFIQDLAGGDDTLLGSTSAVGFSAFAGGGADIVEGSAFADILWGEAGDDVINAHDGADVIVGGAGSDRINGGAGNDALYAGAGDGVRDTIVFHHTGAANADAVYDFVAGTDKIDLSAFGSSFANVSIANAGGSSIVYLNGQQVCTVVGVTTLTAADFVFIPGGAPADPGDWTKVDGPLIQPFETEGDRPGLGAPVFDVDLGMVDLALRPGDRVFGRPADSDYDWIV